MAKASSVVTTFLMTLSTILSCMATTKAQMLTQPPSPSPQPYDNYEEAIVDVKLPIPYMQLLPPLTQFDDPKIDGCVRSLEKVPSCDSDIFMSFLTGNVNLSEDCCSVFEGLPENCLRVIFPFVPTYPAFKDVVRGFCRATQTAPAPALAVGN